jgi:TonB family protein
MKFIAANTVTVVYSLLIAGLVAVYGESASAKKAEADYAPYMDYVQSRIKRHWSPKHFTSTLRSVVRFKIHRNGTLSDLKFDKATGVPTIDQSIMSAVQTSAPFDPLPAGADENIDIQFTFDYNVLLDLEKYRSKRIKDLEKSLAQKETQFGPEHQAVATAVRELADEVLNQGNYQKAEPMYKRAIAIQEKHLPGDERELAKTLSKFGELYYLQRKYAEAEPLYKEALAINEKYPTDNLFLEENMEHYAKLLYVTNRTSQANEFYDRLKEIRNQKQKSH